MTRTERSSYPRATAKDRHMARNGLRTDVPKHGAGSHNWGSIGEEVNHEALGASDEAFEPPEPALPADNIEVTRAPQEVTPPRRLSNVSVEEREAARKERKQPELDLAAIARSSAAGAVIASELDDENIVDVRAYEPSHRRH